MKGERYYWVDYVKCIACILVVLGHLYMSLMSKGWVDGTAFYYNWPIQTVYTFHVPLFFVCSGFLHQVQNKSCTFEGHVRNIKKKALNLGVPYLTFSFITLLLKIIFPSEVNNQATPIIRTLFWEPVAPYWYLYTLFLLFCILPSFKDTKKLKLIFGLSLIVKLIYVICGQTLDLPDLLNKVVANAVWFLLGMVLCEIKLKDWPIYKCGITVGSGVVVSILVCAKGNISLLVQFVIALLFVIPIIGCAKTYNNRFEKSVLLEMSTYFMPIYLMHTIFAAAMRSVLLKIGIGGLIPHLFVGLIASFLFPVVVYRIAEKHWMLLFWFEPGRALKMRKEACNEV